MFGNNFPIVTVIHFNSIHEKKVNEIVRAKSRDFRGNFYSFHAMMYNDLFTGNLTQSTGVLCRQHPVPYLLPG